MWIRKNKEMIGGVATIVAIVITIIAASPQTWTENFAKWHVFIMAINNYLLILLIGILTLIIIIISLKKKRSNFTLCLISGDEYKNDFQKLLKSTNYSIVKIFGYTGEVVNNDLVTYLDRYYSGIEIRYLHRSWMAEEQDEIAHNRKIQHDKIRPWNKSSAIKKVAFEDWNFTLTRNVRYYKHHPIIKGSIFCDKNQKPIIAYINFQKWIPFPKNGGSVFKSVPSEMIKINVKENNNFQELIERIDSQFEYEWRYGNTKEEICAQNSYDKKGDDYVES